MRLLYKLTLATMVPASLIWIVGIQATQESEQSLRASIEETSQARVRAVMDEIERAMRVRISGLRAYAQSDLIKQALADSNAEFALLDEAQREALLNDVDAHWRSDSDRSGNGLLQRLMSNPLARNLRTRLEILEKDAGYPVFGEVFVTNRYGANAAQSGPTTDYRQDDEDWWKKTVQHGLYVQDVAFDESAGIYSVDICLRIEDRAGDLLGVLKAVLNIEEVFSIVDGRAPEAGSGARLILCTNDLRIIRTGGGDARSLEDGRALFVGVLLSPETPRISHEAILSDGASYLRSYALSEGDGDWKGLGWVALIEQGARDVLAPVAQLRKRIFFLAGVATLLAILVGGYFAWSISRRATRLSAATVAIASGQLDTHVPAGGADELSKLARNFNRMTDQLLVARDSLHEAKDEAVSASLAKSAFLANMSHEIRTPIGGVIGLTALLTKTDLNPEQRELVALLDESGDALLLLINDILDFSKIEAGKIELEHVGFQLREVVKRSVQSLATRSAEKRLELTCQVNPAVPDALRGDPGRLRQVLVNLVSNAIKFTEHGQVEIDVGHEPLEKGRVQLRVTVQDTGIGIPAAAREMIFEAFSQADVSTTRQYGGTGLGLAISARLVQLMGGEFSLQSEPGQGSTFSFSVKLEIDTQVSAPRQTREVGAAPATAALSRAPLRILLVEDAPVNQRVVCGYVESWGHSVQIAENGQEALKALSGASFDLVLMDVQMPLMDGYEATERIRAGERETGRHMPIIALTAAAMTEDRARCLEAGMDDHIPKPIDPLLLKRALARYEARHPREQPSVESPPSAGLSGNLAVDLTGARELIPGGEQGLRALAVTMLEEYPGLVTRIRSSWEERDAAGIHLASHTLKGSADLFCARPVVLLAGRLEKLGREGTLKDVPRVLSELERELARMHSELAALLKDPGAPGTPGEGDPLTP